MKRRRRKKTWIVRTWAGYHVCRSYGLPGLVKSDVWKNKFDPLQKEWLCDLEEHEARALGVRLAEYECVEVRVG